MSLHPSACAASFGTLMLLGCAVEEDSAPAADSCSDAAESTTWDNWGAGFFAGYCQTCHASGTTDRRGAPEGMNFDTEAEVRAQAVLIQDAVLGTGNMPVGGGVLPTDLEHLAAFLGCTE